MFTSVRNVSTLLIKNVQKANFCQKIAQPLRSKKSKSERKTPQYFIDLRRVRTLGGKGGDGCISFLQLWANEYAGPDGGDGGNGGHVILKATPDVKDLNHVTSILKADDGEKGFNKDCHGKNASHLIINVPIGTIIKNMDEKIIGDLDEEGTMFIAARGGAGGKGNHFFIKDTEQAPEICEYGADGEKLEYTLEIRSMAHVGLIGLPNAGKSTLLRAISRARPKVAPYPFTTLRPHLGMIQYNDYEQVAVADLPGLIPGSHKNHGLGIKFLKHVDRCMALVYVIDVSQPESWKHFEMLQFELSQFSDQLCSRPQILVANKIDMPGCEKNLDTLKTHVDLPVVALSAKFGTNLLSFLQEIRKIYDEQVKEVKQEKIS